MSIFDEIVKTVNSTIEPSVESVVNSIIDEDEDSTLADACEALGIKTKKKVVNPAELTSELTPEEIKALAETGSEEEDEDDEFADASVDELLEGLPEAVYGEADPEEVVDELSDDDLEAIEDDLDDDDL